MMTLQTPRGKVSASAPYYNAKAPLLSPRDLAPKTAIADTTTDSTSITTSVAPTSNNDAKPATPVPVKESSTTVGN